MRKAFPGHISFVLKTAAFSKKMTREKTEEAACSAEFCRTRGAA